ncbi:hypothetical protein I4F81_005115 [Pyropia yezoensis]|uniref:Uncharacterized protein n=1 Tax=Pyropia yezoensis TaxID=2788 RepID=A0ACC3BXB7_PYRYE|nr:hypothetical protein I4F81_005115 [Neopyropia yezoensis]
MAPACHLSPTRITEDQPLRSTGPAKRRPRPSLLHDRKTLATVLGNLLSTAVDRNEAARAQGATDAYAASATTVFHALDAPAIGVVAYMERLAHYSYCSAPVLLMAYRYIERVTGAMSERVSGVAADELTVHRLMIASVVVAAKTHDDDFLSNHHYALVGGLPLDELNALEVGLLELLGWRTTVTEAEFVDVDMRVAAVVEEIEDAAAATATVASPPPTRKSAPAQSSPTSVQAAAVGYQNYRWSAVAAKCS